MPQAPDVIENLPFRAAPALHEIARGMELKKCRKCGCMQDALAQAGDAFESSEEPEIRSLMPRISDYQSRMEPLAYDCIGCKKCWGVDAIVELANHFDEVELDPCGSSDEHAAGEAKSTVASSSRYARSSAITAWPPHPGDYVLGNPEVPWPSARFLIAICLFVLLLPENRLWQLRVAATPKISVLKKSF